MEINTAKPGNFCWFELATSDQAAAKKFYGGLFGWMGPPACRK
jgi:predicted enzyme related to lactoylglutathione lyase